MYFDKREFEIEAGIHRGHYDNTQEETFDPQRGGDKLTPQDSNDTDRLSIHTSTIALVWILACMVIGWLRWCEKVTEQNKIKQQEIHKTLSDTKSDSNPYMPV